MPGFNNGAGYFLYVGNISEVYSYSVPQGQTMYFMDKNNPIFYIKTVDMLNQQKVTAYDLIERKLVEPSSVDGNYVTRDELSSIVSEAVENAFRSRNFNRNKNRPKEES